MYTIFFYFINHTGILKKTKAVMHRCEASVTTADQIQLT